MGRLIIDGNKVYEIDEKCLEKKRREEYKRKKENRQKEKKRYFS
ncbi:MAG: hypothetical protein ACI4C5_05360 [Lachnospiraceae bacterium]